VKSLGAFLSSTQNILALVFVVGIIAVAIGAPALSPPRDIEKPADFHIHEGRKEVFPLPPQSEIPLGTVIYYQSSTGMVTLLHFDIFHSLIWGTRSVLRFGLIVAISAALIGVVVGAISGYLGGIVNTVVMRVTDAFLAFPVIAGVLLFRLIMESTNMTIMNYASFEAMEIEATGFLKLIQTMELDPVMITLILFSWMAYARVVNANVIALKSMDFTIAARAMGGGSLYVIFRHMIPNAITQVIVLVARDIGGVVVLQAAFAFIGISGTVYSSAIPEWSRILMLGRTWIIGQQGNPLIFWWTYIPVTLAFILFGVCWNMLGDGLNVILNPRTRKNSVSIHA
jgi:peptide/nickel transport system permease protein